jgi:hypothetical protein
MTDDPNHPVADEPVLDRMTLDDSYAPTDAAATLLKIAGELDGHTWTPDTLERIAQHLRAAGLEVRDVAES